MTYKARGREGTQSRQTKERIYEIKQQLGYQLVLFEAGCDVFGLYRGLRVATEVERKASPQIERNIHRDFTLGADVLIIACRTEVLREWIAREVLPDCPQRERIQLITFSELQRGIPDLFKIETWFTPLKTL